MQMNRIGKNEKMIGDRSSFFLKHSLHSVSFRNGIMLMNDKEGTIDEDKRSSV